MRLRNGRQVIAAFVTGLGLTIGLTGASGASAPGRAVKRCAITGTTVAANQSARVYRRGTSSAYVAYACDMLTGWVSKLGTFSETYEDGPYAFRLKGALVAYDYLGCFHSDCAARVAVLDVRRRKERTSAWQPVPAAYVSALELTDAGAVVWIRDLPGAPEVRKFDAGGEAVLDSGPDVDKNSLAVGGSNAYWLKGGQPRTAQLK